MCIVPSSRQADSLNKTYLSRVSRRSHAACGGQTFFLDSGSCHLPGQRYVAATPRGQLQKKKKKKNDEWHAISTGSAVSWRIFPGDGPGFASNRFSQAHIAHTTVRFASHCPV